MEDLYPLFETLMTWFVVPVVGFIWLMYQRIQDHQTSIRVLEARSADAQIVHDREIRDIKDTTEKIFTEIKEVRTYLNNSKLERRTTPQG